MKPSGKNLAIVAAALAALVTLALWSRRGGESEKEIRALVASCVRAVENKQVQVLVEAMSEDFKGPGSATRDAEKSLLTFMLQRPELVAAFNPELSVTVTAADRAEFSGKFVFARAKAQSVAELAAGQIISTYQFDGKLQKVGGRWLFVSANSREL